MANAVQFSVTQENADEVLAAAQQASKGDEKPAEKPAEKADEKPAENVADETAGDTPLEIPEKKEEAEGEVFDLAPFYQEYADTGALSDESRAAIKGRLEKAGFTNADALIDQHMAGAKADVESARQRIFSHVGGEAAYAQIVQWASQNLSPEDIADFNETVKNPKAVKMAVLGLQAQFNAAGNKAQEVSQQNSPKRVTPQSNVSAAFEPIRSDQQVADLVSDKKYLTDPGYRAVVDQRIEASMKAGYLK